jgi:hypothetical protein
MMSLTRREFETVSNALLDALADQSERAAHGFQPRTTQDLPKPARPVSGLAGPVH